MEKKKLILQKDFVESFEYNGFEVSVNTFVTLAEMTSIKEKFLFAYFSGFDIYQTGSFNEALANFIFKKEILNLKTNIDVSIETDEDYINVEALVDSDLFDKVSYRISNYITVSNVVYESLDNEIKRLNMANSIPQRVAKILEFVESLTQVNPEDFEGFKARIQSLLEEIKNGNPDVLNLMKDMNRGQ